MSWLALWVVVTVIGALGIVVSANSLRFRRSELTGEFEFGEDGLPAAFRADRYRDLGDGRSVLTPWSGRYGDYREVGGLLVPHELSASWHVDGREIPYVRFPLEQLELDVNAPF